jgi:transcription initiation factor TFIIH subunit 1
MAPPSGAAAYKKTDGFLTISADEQSVSWTPAGAGAVHPITIHVANISSKFG